jgi:hypothetical protein
VAIAMGTGSIAAVMIDQHLRRQEVGAGLRPATGDPPPAAG